MSIECFDGATSFVISTYNDLLLCFPSGSVSSDTSEEFDLFIQGFTPVTFSDLFEIPIASDLNQLFMIGLFIPLLSYLTAWSFGVLINWFSRPDEH